LKAGHPTLVFELDSQSVNEPKHWRDNDPWIGPRAWLTGQAVALREAVWRSRTDFDAAGDMQETAIALAWLLAKATMVEPALAKISEPAFSDLEPVQRQADELARRAPSWNPNIDSTMAILRALVATDSEFVVSKETSAQTLWYRARRVVLALDSLSAALNQNRGAPLKMDSELNSLHEDVRLRENFAPPQFAEHVRKFRAALTK